MTIDQALQTARDRAEQDTYHRRVRHWLDSGRVTSVREVVETEREDCTYTAQRRPTGRVTLTIELADVSPLPQTVIEPGDGNKGNEGVRIASVPMEQTP